MENRREAYLELVDYIFPNIMGATKEKASYSLDGYTIAKKESEAEAQWELFITEENGDSYLVKRTNDVAVVFDELFTSVETLHREEEAFTQLYHFTIEELKSREDSTPRPYTKQRPL